jgi:DNA-binding CsgD family transcriptional regulator
LIQAMTNSRLYGEAVEDAMSRMVALDSIERALLSVKTNGTIRWLTRSAIALCRKYSLFRNRSEDRLSVAMCEWMRKPESAGGPAVASGCIPLTVHGPHGIVSLRVLSRTPQTLLAIEEYSNHNSLEKLRSFGLSPRRTEILRWIAEGKSNPEIASILSISVRTVAKHIEKLYQDLGVDHRHAAMALVLNSAGR